MPARGALEGFTPSQNAEEPLSQQNLEFHSCLHKLFHFKKKTVLVSLDMAGYLSHELVHDSLVGVPSTTILAGCKGFRRCTMRFTQVRTWCKDSKAVP